MDIKKWRALNGPWYTYFTARSLFNKGCLLFCSRHSWTSTTVSRGKRQLNPCLLACLLHCTQLHININMSFFFVTHLAQIHKNTKQHGLAQPRNGVSFCHFDRGRLGAFIQKKEKEERRKSTICSLSRERKKKVAVIPYFVEVLVKKRTSWVSEKRKRKGE